MGKTLLLLFKCANHRDKRPLVSTANKALVGTLMAVGDINPIFQMGKERKGTLHKCVAFVNRCSTS